MPGDPSEAAVAIDSLLADLPSDQRAALQALRATIARTAPEAEEGFSYGMPAFRYGGRPLVAYGAFSRHCSLYPMSGTVLESLGADLEGFRVSRGTIRFTPVRPLPTSLVERIVRTRILEIDARRARQRRCPRARR